MHRVALALLFTLPLAGCTQPTEPCTGSYWVRIDYDADLPRDPLHAAFTATGWTWTNATAYHGSTRVVLTPPATTVTVEWTDHGLTNETKVSIVAPLDASGAAMDVSASFGDVVNRTLPAASRPLAGWVGEPVSGCFF